MHLSCPEYGIGVSTLSIRTAIGFGEGPVDHWNFKTMQRKINKLNSDGRAASCEPNVGSQYFARRSQGDAYTHMVLKKPEPQHLTYLKALQLIADQSKRELATLMPHLGERGRIAEEIIRGVLHRTLPKRFSIGTGVLISAAGETSFQTDIVIFDNFHNSPLLSEFGVGVYPVEIVYATIEVKSRLTKNELKKSLAAIRKIRRLGSSKHYVVPTVAINAGGGTVASSRVTIKVPPRSYIVAFDQSGFGKKYDDFRNTLSTCLDENNDHVHGVAVLSEDWFAGRKAYRNPTELHGEEGNALLNLYSSILKGQQNFAVYPVDLDMYLNVNPG